MNHTPVRLFFVSSFLLAVGVHGAEGPLAAAAESASFEQTFRSLAENVPSLKEAPKTLQFSAAQVARKQKGADVGADLRMVLALRSSARERVSDKFPDYDADQALGSAWVRTRVGPDAVSFQRSLTAELLLNALDDMGKLVIRTMPSGATATLDGIPLSDRTNLKRLEAPGKYRLRLEKPGYQPVTEDGVEVRRGEETVIEKQLVAAP